ncbi:hypothetical protein PHJA_001492000 [Phtheirospermum japonicum]|uniref:Uncharacterized protein n=1 Tax=Phtheirospermum japonicum TaxID=374723 RepID=A0A830C322_9LAMI|nr:hypothetical protein PHJA_001492000 [Phtheirospermum japonicum]
MARHLSFCSKFRASGPPQDPTVQLIRAMRRLLRQELGKPKMSKVNVNMKSLFFCYVYGKCFTIIL